MTRSRVTLPNTWVLQIACLAVVSLPTAGHAEPLTRARALQLAMDNNPQVAAARAREAGALARAEQVDAARYPELSVIVGVGPSLKAKLVDGTAAQSTESMYSLGFDDVSVVVGTQLEVLQPLYTFGKIGRRDDATQHDRRARAAQTNMTRAEIALETARLYEGLLLARELRLFAEDIDAQLGHGIESTQHRFEDGEVDVSEADVLQLQSARSIARLQLHHAQAAERQAGAGLRAYLGIAQDAPLELAETQLAALGGAVGELAAHQREAIANRPELRALREGASAKRALADAEEAGGLPDLFAQGLLSARYTPGRDVVESRYVIDPQQQLVPALLLGMRWQWQAGRADARASEQRAEAAQLEGTRDWALTAIPAEVRRSFEDALRARLDIEEAVQAVALSKRWVVLVTADHTVGLADSQRVVDALEAYARLRVSHLDAIYRYNVAMAELSAATGTLDSQTGGPYLSGAARGNHDTATND